MFDVLLGSENDDSLFHRLVDEVKAMGGSIADAECVLGGSQEVTMC